MYALALLTSNLVLVMLLGAAFLGAFFYLLKNPPVIHVDIGDVRFDVVGTLDATQAIPSVLTVRVQPVQPAPSGDREVLQQPMPLDVLLYVDQESDEWAREARRKRARSLFAELADWPLVLTALKREDEVVDDTVNKG